jgi:hypothetical protein
MVRKRVRNFSTKVRRSGSHSGVPRRWFERVTKRKLLRSFQEAKEFQPAPLIPSSREFQELLSRIRNEMDRVCGMSEIFEDGSGVIMISSRFSKEEKKSE